MNILANSEQQKSIIISVSSDKMKAFLTLQLPHEQTVESAQVFQELEERGIVYGITMPLLILWGVEDVNIMQELAEQSLTYCDQASLVKFDCTHWIQHEEPERVNQMIADFIGQD